MCLTFLCATCFAPHTEFILDFDLCFHWPYFEQTKMSEFPLKSFQLCQGQSLPVPWASISLGWCKGTPWAISICCPLGPASSVMAGGWGPCTLLACPAIPCGWQRFGFIKPQRRRGVHSFSSAQPPPCAGHCHASLCLVSLPSRAGQGRRTRIRPRAVLSRPIRDLGGGAVSGGEESPRGFPGGDRLGACP